MARNPRYDIIKTFIITIGGVFLIPFEPFVGVLVISAGVVSGLAQCYGNMKRGQNLDAVAVSLRVYRPMAILAAPIFFFFTYVIFDMGNLIGGLSLFLMCTSLGYVLYKTSPDQCELIRGGKYEYFERLCIYISLIFSGFAVLLKIFG